MELDLLILSLATVAMAMAMTMTVTAMIVVIVVVIVVAVGLILGCLVAGGGGTEEGSVCLDMARCCGASYRREAYSVV